GTDDLFYRPRHAYTLGLLSSLARLDRRRVDLPGGGRLKPIVGQPPSLIRVPPGCAFNPRCPFATDVCRTDRPELTPAPDAGVDHLAACHHSDEVARQPSVIGATS
ncbi:MAG: glutathione transport system ATP-binding protein, partial [Actinomycetota bacterium]|nr:glutathione transport system ATP-binding protein [Actinomycetota bacterium]